MFRFYDSFGHYTPVGGLNTLMAQKWDVVCNPYGVNASAPSEIVDIFQGTTIGRFGAGGVEFIAPNVLNINSVGQANDGQYIQKNYSGVSVIHKGLAVLQTATQITNGGRLLTLLDGATTQVGIDIMPSGQLRAVRSTLAGTGIFLSSVGTSFAPATFTELGTSVAAIFSNTYDYLQVKVTHHPTAGEIEIKRGDGSAFWTLSNVNTAISGANQSASVLVGGYGSVWTANLGTLQCHYLRAKVSDFLLYDTVADGSDALSPVTFCGDRHGERISLTADGFYAQSTPSTGSTRFDLIEEVPPNTTDYNTLPSVGIKDSFVVSAAGGPAAASAFLIMTMYLQKTSGGANEMKGLFRLSGADRNGSAFQVPSPWAFKQSALFSKPGGGAITVADVQPATGQPGYEKTV